MARITVEDCLKQTENRFSMTLLACKRARKLATSGIRPLLPWENDKPTVMALREIAAGLIGGIEDIDKERAPDPGSIAAMEAEAEKAIEEALLAQPIAADKAKKSEVNATEETSVAAEPEGVAADETVTAAELDETPEKTSEDADNTESDQEKA